MSEGARGRKALPQWLIVIPITFTGMLAYEWTKEVLAPGFTKWQSHWITIVFSTALAAAAGYAVSRKQAWLAHDLRRAKEAAGVANRHSRPAWVATGPRAGRFQRLSRGFRCEGTT